MFTRLFNITEPLSSPELQWQEHHNLNCLRISCHLHVTTSMNHKKTFDTFSAWRPPCRGRRKVSVWIATGERRLLWKDIRQLRWKGNLGSNVINCLKCTPALIEFVPKGKLDSNSYSSRRLTRLASYLIIWPRLFPRREWENLINASSESCSICALNLNI